MLFTIAATDRRHSSAGLCPIMPAIPGMAVRDGLQGAASILASFTRFVPRRPQSLQGRLDPSWQGPNQPTVGTNSQSNFALERQWHEIPRNRLPFESATALEFAQ